MTQLAETTAACERCHTAIEVGDLRCAVCALPVAERQRRPVDAPRVSILRCTECGAAIGFDATRQAPACAFCGAVMAVEQPVDPVETAQQRVPFAVDRELAVAALRGWLGTHRRFAPASLRDEAVFESLTPISWAAWRVNARASVSWTADSDAGSERSAWAPHAGVVSLTFDEIVIPASRGLTHGECALLVPYYDLATLAPAADEADGIVESFDAQRSAARDLVQRAIQGLAKRGVEPVIPGRRVRNIRVSCLLEGQTTDRIALPAWVLTYRYRGSPYRAIVHGQRPEIVFGSVPTDWAKVARLVGLVAAVLVAIAALVLALTGHRP